MISRGDVVTFSETDKVIIMDIVEYLNETYTFVNDILPDESGFTDKYHVMKYNQERNTLIEIVDQDFLNNEILPLFSDNLQKIFDSGVLNFDKAEGSAN